jgi:hypothetical protein
VIINDATKNRCDRQGFGNEKTTRPSVIAKEFSTKKSAPMRADGFLSFSWPRSGATLLAEIIGAKSSRYPNFLEVAKLWLNFIIRGYMG